MANKIKKTTLPTNANPEHLVDDKQETITWEIIGKDQRTKKIVGVSFLLIALILFTAFTSYIFTWQVDQDELLTNGTHYLFVADIKPSNLLGRLGALTAHFFIYKGFGVASYLICTLFFVLGVNLLFVKKYFSLIVMVFMITLLHT